MRPRQQHIFQVVQNKAADFIGDFRWDSGIQQYVKQTLLGLEPLNARLSQQNKDIWTSLGKLLPDEVVRLKENAESLQHCYRTRWPSSLLASMEDLQPGFCTLRELGS